MNDDEKFEYAVNLVLAMEGGYVNHPSDKGRETKYGISKRSNPNVNIKNLTVRQAKQIYYIKYWRPNRYYLIKNTIIAAKIFDIAVHAGSQVANKMLQRALWATGCKNVAETGILDEQTLKATNRAKPAVLLSALKSEVAGYYRIISSKDDNKLFLRGWLRRAYS
ncbi:putative Peptidoglycan domain protein [Candidatus Fokinia solitaria]|uniref:Putative Peptidoglycan domain protein n=1 Tax=Candidatus Fokinia solitaria TaxID=1802984 RepID=A0A2U8BT17_9RICK|nr:glycosyl hydrolase 108 family protein [Candidatus Fokinia solitaria]AWD33448.1 putative Peptidoglycan domain protein [Candidatus Fokinia solitaria]